MDPLYSILIATLVVSVVSFVGIFFASTFVHRMMRLMISFAAGALLATAFFDLLPEALETVDAETALALTLGGMVIFFILDRFIFWYHCHKEKCKVHSFTYLSLVGDGLHNLIDGMIISASFLTDVALGVATTIAVIFHEIPQEISDFSILVYGGLKKNTALLFNFLTALTAVIGALLVYYFALNVKVFSGVLVAVAAGGFIYIAGSDLIPEIHKERRLQSSITQLLIFLLGIVVMWVVTMVLHT